MGGACTNTRESLPVRPVRRRSERSVTTSIANIQDVYRFDPKVVGHGHFGTVRLATPKGASGSFAVKTVSKEKIKRDMKLLLRELALLRDLDHPNIIKFYENYQDRFNFHYVMEYCSGGELMDRFSKKGHFDEREASSIMSKAFSAVKYLHDRDIVHRDIKPENFLYATKESDSDIKLIDFGLSCYIEPLQSLESRVGTPYYVAPEVIKGKYDHRCDFWSLGIMMYLFLCGHQPFEAQNVAELAKKIVGSTPNYTCKEFLGISQNAKDLIKGLLNKDPAKRTTAKQALEHPWVKMGQKVSHIAHEHAHHIIDNLRHFSLKNKLKKEVLNMLISRLDEKELRQLREAFRYFDKQNTGEITMSNLRQVIQEQSLLITDQELEEIIKTTDVDESHTIGFSEFLAAAMDTKLYLTKEMLLLAFNHFDCDNSGYITTKDLRETMRRAAKRMSPEEIDEMIKEVDISKDGKIDFEEFCALMKVGDLKKDVQEEYDKNKSKAKERSISKFRQNHEFFPSTGKH